MTIIIIIAAHFISHSLIIVTVSQCSLAVCIALISEFACFDTSLRVLEKQESFSFAFSFLSYNKI